MYIRNENFLLNAKFARVIYAQNCREDGSYLRIELDDDKRNCGYAIKFSSYEKALEALEYVDRAIMRGDKIITVNSDIKK